MGMAAAKRRRFSLSGQWRPPGRLAQRDHQHTTGKGGYAYCDRRLQAAGDILCDPGQGFTWRPIHFRLNAAVTTPGECIATVTAKKNRANTQEHWKASINMVNGDVGLICVTTPIALPTKTCTGEHRRPEPRVTWRHLRARQRLWITTGNRKRP